MIGVTPRQKSEEFNRALGTTLIWAGAILMTIMLIAGAINGMTLRQLLWRIAWTSGIVLLGTMCHE